MFLIDIHMTDSCMTNINVGLLSANIYTHTYSIYFPLVQYTTLNNRQFTQYLSSISIQYQFYHSFL